MSDPSRLYCYNSYFENNIGYYDIMSKYSFIENCSFNGGLVTYANIGHNTAFSQVNINNCNFYSTVTTSKCNIEFKGGSGSVIRNSYFDNSFTNNGIYIYQESSGNFIDNCTFINLAGSQECIYITGNCVNNLIFNNTFVNTTSNRAGASFINDEVPISILDNIFNTGSSYPDIVGDYYSFNSYDVLYVDENGGGSGISPDDRTNLEWAINNINIGGVIYVAPGIYDLDSSRYSLRSNLIGEDKGVVINYASFNIVVCGCVIEIGRAHV